MGSGKRQRMKRAGFFLSSSQEVSKIKTRRWPESDMRTGRGRTGMTDEELNRRVDAAVKIAQMKNFAMGVPNIVYDSQTQKICELRENGELVPVAERALKGRYRERVDLHHRE